MLLRRISINCNKIFVRNLTSSNEVRVRFAPSPTGKLHIGGLRTAFYNYLFAKKHNGTFILRIEDTDQERLQPGSIENIIKSLNWAGIEADYGPNIVKSDDMVQGAPWMQSKRLELYQKHIELLIEQGKAYYCFCDETRLELLRRNAAKRQENLKYDRKCLYLSSETIKSYLNEQRPHVIRFKLDDRDVIYEDMANGIHKSNPGKQEGDFVILKSDKFPTYHFANVVDDHAMRITHVLRGQEWQSSTAKHLQLYEAFGWKPPAFAHLPLILNSDGTKISKRQKDTDVMSYKSLGYLSETLLAYLSTIGGGVRLNILNEENPELLEKNFKNFVSILVDNFDETKLNVRPIKLNQDLLDRYNRLFINLKLNTSDRVEITNELRNLIKEKYPLVNEHNLSETYLLSVLNWSEGRVNKLSDLIEDSCAYLWTDMSYLSNEGVNFDTALQFIDRLNAFLNTVEAKQLKDVNFVKNELKKFFKSIKIDKSKDITSNNKPLNHWEFTRLILTGSLTGPSVAELFILLGKDTVLHRLEIANKFCSRKIN